MIHRALAAFALAASVATAGCGLGGGTTGSVLEGEAVGLVVNVEGPGPATVERFSLRTADGRVLVIAVEPGALSPDSFAPAHLREHLTSGQEVLVGFEERGDRLVATSLLDAP